MLANGWDTATQNWKLASNDAPTTYIDTPADDVVFDDSASAANTTVNLNSANLSPSSVTFSNSTNNYTLQGAFGIAGLTPLSKTGTGTATLAIPNTYTGLTTVSQGALNIQHANALGATSANTVVSSGGALQVQGGITTANEALTLNGTGVTADGALRNVADNNTYSGLVTLGSSGVRINSDAGTLTLSNTSTITGSGFALTVGGAGNTTINSIIGTGAGTLTKDGNGTLILAAANTYTGATTINAGTLQVGNGPTGSLAVGSAITNNSNLVFFRNNAAGVDPAGVISGSGSVAYNGPGVPVSLQGQFTVGDANAYTGPTSVTNARVIATNATALGTGAGAVVTVNPGGQVYMNTAITIANPFIISGDGWTEAAGVLGAIRLNAGATISGPVTMVGNSRLSSYGSTGTFSGVISGAFNLEITGQAATNQLTFSGVNTYTGATTITSGILSVGTIGDGGVAGNLGQATNDAFNLVLNGGTLRYTGATASTDRNFTIATPLAGIIEVSTAATNLTFNGAADFATGGLTKTGAGTLTLRGANGYLGATTTSAGTLALDGGGSIINSADFIVGNTTGTAATFNLINGTVSLSGPNVLSASAATTPTTTVFTYNQTGGALDFTNATGFIGISNNGGTSNFNVSAGTFTAYNNSGMNLGVRGNATLTVSGTGTVALPALTYGHPSTAGGNSTVNLDGGVLQIGAGRVVRASGTATFNFNGGILQPTAASTTFMTGLNTTNVRNGGAIVDTDGFDITIGQSLTHSAIGGDNAIDGGLTKNGAGTLTLSGLNNYTGSTNVAGGTLLVTGSLSGAGAVSVAGSATLGGSGSVGTTTVAAGGTIEAGVAGSGQLTLTGLTFSGAGTVNIGTLANYAASPGVQVSGVGALIPNGGANSVMLNIASLSGITLASPYKLIGYAGAIGGSGFGGFTLAPLPNRAVGALSDTGSEIRLTINSTDFVKWTGAGVLANGWDTTTQNWKLGSNNLATTYINAPADAVVFDDDAALTNTTVAIDTANVNPASVSFANATKDYVVQGTYGITGATGLTKTGAASVTIATANSYAGATTISQGVLNIQNADALGSASGGTTVASGAALQVQGFITTPDEALTLNGSGISNDGALRNLSDDNTYSGLVTLGSNTRINSDFGTLTLSHAGTITGAGFGLLVGGAGNTTINGIIGTGSGNLIKDGIGTLVLNGANTFAGGVVIGEGILRAGSDLALGAVANSVTVGNGGALDINGRTLQGYTQRILISGAGAASEPTLGALGNGPGTVDNLNTIRDIELTGDATVGGDGARWDIGRIDFTADPAATVDHITGNGFVLTKVGTSYLGLLTGASNLAGFIMNGGIIAPHENTSFGSGPVIVNAGIVKPWGGPTFANDFTLAGGALTEQDGFTDTYNGPITVSDATTSTLTPVNGNILLNGNISGTGGLLKDGAFSVFLNGDNGAFAGTYQNDVSNTFFGVATGGSANAAFVVNGGNLAGRAAGAYTVDLGSLAGTGGNVGNDLAGSEVTFSIGGDDTDTTFSGAIVDTVGGGGTTAITKVGTGELTLEGALSYTGLTTITEGTLNINAALGSGANVVNADSGTTNFGESQTLSALNIGAGAVVALVTPPPPAAGDFAGNEAPEALVGGGAVAAVPEPGSLSLVLLGALGLLGRRKRNA